MYGVREVQEIYRDFFLGLVIRPGHTPPTAANVNILRSFNFMFSFGDGHPSTRIVDELEWIAELTQGEGMTEREFMICLADAIRYFLEYKAKYIWEKGEGNV
jgi:hypothetical protein